MILFFALHRMIKVQITFFHSLFWSAVQVRVVCGLFLTHSINRIASLNNMKVLNEYNNAWETSSAVALQGAELRPSDDVTRFGQATDRLV